MGGGGVDQKTLPTHGVRKTIRREKQRKNEKIYIYIYTSDIEIKT